MSATPMRSCRICGHRLFPAPLLIFENMPKAAQHLPLASELHEERGASLTVCQCGSCGLVQLSEPPVPYYRDVIRTTAISQPLREDKTRQFSEFVAQHALQGKTLLEIGCGKGEFLSIFQNVGLRASGLEHAVDSVSFCKTKGLNVIAGYLEQPQQQLPGAPFDSFALLMFLEHMPNPNTALSAIHYNLAKGAVGIIEVPNFEMVIGNALFSEFIADHLFYFTRDTLSFTLQRNGFEILKIDTLRDDYVLSATVRKRGPLDLSDFATARTSLCSSLHNYINSFPPRSVAIWGAGHQALTLISLAGLADMIAYVVDSAPFKQGRFTPATHLPILSPAILDSKPPSALVIMAASYSDEVATIVRERFGSRIPFAILRETGLCIPDDSHQLDFSTLSHDPKT